MAIQDILNPSDGDDEYVSSRSPSYDSSSEHKTVTTASSPEAAQGSKTDTTIWTAGSEDTTIMTLATEDTAVMAPATEEIAVTAPAIMTPKTEDAAVMIPKIEDTAVMTPATEIKTTIIPATKALAINTAPTEVTELVAIAEERTAMCLAKLNALYRANKARYPSCGSKIDRRQRKIARRRRQSAPSHGFQDPPNNTPARGRKFRAPYTYEQVMWLWFHFIDLKGNWDDIEKMFHAEWPGDDRNKVGMQCKAYRITEQYGLPKRRAQTEGPKNPLRYGMWPNKRHSYKWMDPYANRLIGQSMLNMMMLLQRLR